MFARQCKALLDGIEIHRNSALRRVGPYIDPDCGLMKVDGRLEHAELPARTRHPIIIAPDHPLTKLIIEDCHQKVQHSGVEQTSNILREQYYLPQGRRTIRLILRKVQTLTLPTPSTENGKPAKGTSSGLPSRLYKCRPRLYWTIPSREEAFDGLTRRRWKQAQFIVDQFWRR